PSRRALDRAPDPLVGTAAADVAVHGGIDLGVGGVRRFCQQRRRRHDLSRLTVTALRNLLGGPSLLYGTVQSFYGGDLARSYGGDRSNTGADGLAVQVHGAGAKPGAAAKFGDGQAERVAEDPQEGSGGLHVRPVLPPVNGQGDGGHGEG